MKRTVVFLLIISLLFFTGCNKPSAEDYFQSAEAYLAKKDYLKAAADYVRAYQTDKEMIDAYLGAMQMYRELGIEFRYYECIEELIANNSENPEAYIIAAEKYIKETNLDKAIEICLRQIETIPTASDGYKLISKLYYNKKDLDNALYYSTLLMDLFPDDIDGYSYTLEYLLAKNQNSQAKKIAIEINSKFPEDTLGYLYHSYLLYLEGKYEEAEKIASKSPDQSDLRIVSVHLMIKAKSVITFTDPAFESAMREYLHRETGDILLEDTFNIQTIEIIGGEKPKMIFDGDPFSLETAVEVLDDLIYFEYIYSFSIRIHDLKDFSPIASFKDLYSLSLISTNVTDISFVKELSSLTSLAVTNGILEDLTPIESLSNLEILDLQYNKIKNLPNFEKLEKLSAVYLNNNSLSDISNLSKAISLSSLFLANNPRITDVEALRSLTNLTSLSLSGCSVTNLAPIEHVANLTV